MFLSPICFEPAKCVGKYSCLWQCCNLPPNCQTLISLNNRGTTFQERNNSPHHIFCQDTEDRHYYSNASIPRCIQHVHQLIKTNVYEMEFDVVCVAAPPYLHFMDELQDRYQSVNHHSFQHLVVYNKMYVPLLWKHLTLFHNYQL